MEEIITKDSSRDTMEEIIRKDSKKGHYGGNYNNRKFRNKKNF